jgi:anti-anti-sigma regulatory factor
MLKIQKSANRRLVVFALSGRIEERHVPELQALFEAEDQGVMLDLNEVNLVDREAVRFLARCEARGVRLDNCPGYIREWILREKSST